MARILYLAQIDTDPAAVRPLPTECERVGMRRPLILTDAGVRAAGVRALAEQALGAVRAVNARLGLPAGLAAMGVTRELFERVIDGALADHGHKANPRLASRDDYRQRLEDSL